MNHFKKNYGSIFFLGKKGKPAGGVSEGGFSKGHNFSVFFFGTLSLVSMVEHCHLTVLNDL